MNFIRKKYFFFNRRVTSVSYIIFEVYYNLDKLMNLEFVKEVFKIEYR